MAWFKKARTPIAATSKEKQSRVPEGLWVKCPGCSQIIYNKDLATNLNVCPKCAHHFRVSAAERLRMLFDGDWVEYDKGLVSTDPLAFTDTKPYKSRLKAGVDATGLRDAVIVATGTIDGIDTVVASMPSIVPDATMTASLRPVASVLALRRCLYGFVSVKASGSVETSPLSYSAHSPSNSIRKRSTAPTRK